MNLTPKQEEALRLLGGPAKHILLAGGSRSGKTFAIVRAIVVRALAASGSRHAMLRFRYNAIISSIVMDTFPKVMSLCWPEIKAKMDNQRGMCHFANGSEIWFGGLDDKERVEKILGMEFSTIFLGECSQIPYSSRNVAVTRLAQRVQVDGQDRDLRLKMMYDENPPSKAHWTYRLFHEKRDPETRELVTRPDDYAMMYMNPMDNVVNLPADYLETLKGLSARLQKRFLRGEFADATPNALFRDEDIDKWRVLDGSLPDMQRIVIGVDPSGSGDADNADNDAIGIVVAGLGTDGNAYILEDCTVKAGPATWGNIATTAYERHAADCIIGEVNYGGAMVEAVIRAARPRTPFKAVTASRGKVVRAEPISSLYEAGKCRHVGYFRELEDELTAFSTVGYMGGSSPNRADALIWALSELFPGLVNPRKAAKPYKQEVPIGGENAWMGV